MHQSQRKADSRAAIATPQTPDESGEGVVQRVGLGACQEFGAGCALGGERWGREGVEEREVRHKEKNIFFVKSREKTILRIGWFVSRSISNNGEYK